MINRNTKASDSTLTDKQYKLHDFIPKFTKFPSNDLDFSNKYRAIDDNLYQSVKHDKLYFKSINVHCNKCNHNKVRMNATIERKIIFLNIEMQTCLVQQLNVKNIVLQFQQISQVLLDQIQTLLNLLSNI